MSIKRTGAGKSAFFAALSTIAFAVIWVDVPETSGEHLRSWTSCSRIRSPHESSGTRKWHLQRPSSRTMQRRELRCFSYL
jgi:hypothetical protein